MKIAVILGPMSIGSRPLDFWYNNIFESSRGATGTDIAFCMISKELQKLGHDIHMFTIHAQPDHKPDVWEGCKLYNFMDVYKIIDDSFDSIISLNEPDVFRGINSNAIRICYQFLNDFTYCQFGFDNYVDHWVGVCEAHKNYLLSQPVAPNANKWSIIPLGVDPNWYTDQRVPGRVVWTSSADRGLHNLLEVWPKIKSAVPHASLRIFYHFEYGNLLSVEPNDLSQHHSHTVEMANRLRYIVEAIKRLENLDVVHCKSVSRNQMIKEMNEASVFAFPCDTVAVTEGFSVSTLEAHASFTVPVITDQDCLGSIYNNSGAIVLKSPVRDNLPEFANAVIKGLSDTNFADEVIEKCRKFSFNHTWTNTAQMMESLITSKLKKMTNKEYTNAVDQKEYPSDPLVPLDSPFVDNRGSIQNLLNTSINGAAIITSKAGSIRSNHWHREDFHYLYVVSGSMEYYERDVGNLDNLQPPIIVNAGQMVFTPPNKVHKTIFLEDTVLISFSKRNRDHKSHEEDLVREEY